MTGDQAVQAIQAVLAQASAGPASTYVLGAYYYPGWMAGDSFNTHQPDPWSILDAYSDREPLIGRFADDRQADADAQIRSAKSFGLGFFNVVWYGVAADGADTITQPSKPTAGLLALLASPEAGPDFKISLLWDSLTAKPLDVDAGKPTTPARFLARFDAACAAIALHIQANRSKWLMRDSEYVITIRGEYWSTNYVKASGLTAGQLLSRMRVTMAAASPAVLAAGLHVAFWGTASGFWLRSVAQLAMFDSYTSYGWESILNKDGAPTVGPIPTTYAGYAAVFKATNQWILTGASNASNTIGLIVPLSCGWDASPWGGTKIGRPAPEEFRAHLLDHKAMIDDDMRGANRTKGFVVICSWNEIGEGSYLMPTKGDNGALAAVFRDVFKA